MVAVSQLRVVIDQGHHGSCRNCARAAREHPRACAMASTSRPHNVGVPASVLFVDDDCAGLILKAERTLRAFSRTSPSRATASAGTRKASSSDALSTRPSRLKNVWAPVSPKEPGAHCFLPGTVTWVTYRFPRVLFGAAAGPGLGFARLPGGCFKGRRDLLFPAGAISLERALTESSARRTTCTARACC